MYTSVFVGTKRMVMLAVITIVDKRRKVCFFFYNIIRSNVTAYAMRQLVMKLCTWLFTTYDVFAAIRLTIRWLRGCAGMWWVAAGRVRYRATRTMLRTFLIHKIVCMFSCMCLRMCVRVRAYAGVCRKVLEHTIILNTRTHEP